MSPAAWWNGARVEKVVADGLPVAKVLFAVCKPQSLGFRLGLTLGRFGG